MKSAIPKFLRSWIWVFACFSFQSVLGQGTIELQIVDESTGESVPSRLQFVKSPRKVSKPSKVTTSDDQWLVEQDLSLSLANGEYEFLVRRGPEFKDIRGGFAIERKAKDVVTVEIPRSVDMHAESWYSGDHMSGLSIDTLGRWQAADAIDMAVSVAATVPPAAQPPVGAASGKLKARSNTILADSTTPSLVGFNLRTSSTLRSWGTGTVVIHGMSNALERNPIDTSEGAAHATGSDSKSINLVSVIDEMMRSKDASRYTIELSQPWQRDVPILLATEAIHAFQLLSNYNRNSEDFRTQWNSGTSVNRGLGKVVGKIGNVAWASDIFAPIEADDIAIYKDGRSTGRLAEHIYWQMLEAGLRLTPTAASGFSGTESSLGYNRVYVQSDVAPTQSSWWESIQRGQTMVTNGPLLRVKVNSLPPGSVQSSYRGRPIPLDIEAALTVRDPVEYLDVVFNGNTIYSARLEDHYRKGEFPPLEVVESGWLIVRVVTSHSKGYRLATTAPFFFEFDGKRRVNKSAVDFFKQWLDVAISDLSGKELEATKPWIEKAKQYWAKLNANP